MSVSAHRHQVATLLLDPFDDFLDRFAVRQLGLGRYAKRLKLGPNFFQVCGVFGDFGTDRVPAIGSSCPTIGHMQQHQTAVREFRELFDVLDNRPVGRCAVQRHENGVVHRPLSRRHPPTMTCHAAFSESGRPKMSIAVIRIALPQPAIRRNQPFFQGPIRLRELVNCRSGNMANGSCKASTTWLRTSRSVTLLSPRRPITKTAGRMAIVRVISRRSQGLIRQCMKPSITTCPASVPVMVLLWPLARSATANSVLATVAPNNGASVRYATRIQSLLALNVTTCPPAMVALSFPKNTMAASTRIAALTKKAMLRATTESMLLKRIALRMDGSSFCNWRLCTRAECRYRLWGITVAPMMPMARYNIPN